MVAPAELPLLGLISTVAPLVAMGNAVVTGLRDEVVPTLAAHDDVDGVWAFVGPEGSAEVERLSTGNMKRTWCAGGLVRDWFDDRQGEGPGFLRESTQIKNIWVPYGE